MGVMDSFDTGVIGIRAHSKRVEVAAKNIANLDTPNYVRKIPVLHATEDISFSNLLSNMKNNVFSSGTVPFVSGGVQFSGVVEDPTPAQKVYKPGHPDADKDGYVKMSNVNPMVDIADATLAQRAYEASLGVISITKSMANRAIEIGE